LTAWFQVGSQLKARKKMSGEEGEGEGGAVLSPWVKKKPRRGRKKRATKTKVWEWTRGRLVEGERVQNGRRGFVEGRGV